MGFPDPAETWIGIVAQDLDEWSSLLQILQDIWDSHISHWKEVRNFHVRKRRKLLEPARERLAALIPESQEQNEAEKVDTNVQIPDRKAPVEQSSEVPPNTEWHQMFAAT